MSFYRDKYLKSDHWHTLRIRKLIQQDGKCALCRHPAWNNDVHHVDYRKLFDVRLGDLRILCRECHDAAHAALKAHPEVKKLKGNAQWSKLQRLLWKTHTVWRIVPHNRTQVNGMHRAFLLAARKRLLAAKVIADPREMPRTPVVYRRMTSIGYQTDMDILRICLSCPPVFPLAYAGEH